MPWQNKKIKWRKVQAGNGQRPWGMEEDCKGRQGEQQTAELEVEEEGIYHHHHYHRKRVINALK